MLLSTHRAAKEIAQTDLPLVWPLIPAGKVNPADKAEWKAHLDACHRGDVARIQAELIRCKANPAYTVMTHFFTKDEHDASHPVKRFPRKKYIVRTINELNTNPKIAIPKSRQIMITWTCISYLVYKAIFFRHRLIFLQSKKEEDAAALIDRAKHIYEHMPWWLREAAPTKRPLKKLPFNKLMFLNGSLMWGVPQGSDVLRQYTASIIFGDESAFQEKAEEAYTASKPTTDGGGQIILVSSANGRNFFFRVVKDLMDASDEVVAAA
jgi:hypothetical protein